MEIESSHLSWGFPGCPVVKVLASNTGGAGSVTDPGTQIPYTKGQGPKKEVTSAHSGEQERERHSWLYHYFPVPGVCFPAPDGKEVVCRHTAKVTEGMRVSVRK